MGEAMIALTPKRRWFQFGTRAKIAIAAFSLVLVAIAIWFGCELYSIHVRKAFLAKVIAEGGHWQDHEAFKFDSRISSFREFFGDTSVAPSLSPMKQIKVNMMKRPSCFLKRCSTTLLETAVSSK